ncbi:FAD:protein FMN transferase [Mycobacterium sp. OTB74]|jgi:thiamine biosynthesis lipoprotein|uniref:FAD:protein FMN transferase n=1 Tax=Mycobacterium sp. OTB74 TaxID=1853452 RepID=UPI002476A9D6|nr:FAD:protein FMN transferase [Mycobacterium sp. OTB74]MDH6244471.1 thiamine biosynthesis lipoprotein [Mycobacterium sp. OTB74]
MTIAEQIGTTETAAMEWQRWSMSMQIVVTDPDCLGLARSEVDAELDAIDVAASRFRSDSEINALAMSAGEPTEVSAVLADLLDAALTAAYLTDGDVDPTVGAASIALGYDGDYAGVRRALPLAASMTIPAVWSMVRLDGRVATVPHGIVLDLGATAKAVAADRCAQRVQIASGSGVLINLGGDIATAGTAPAGGWQILVHDDDGDPASSIGLPAGAALATSSTVRRRWRRGADVFHHILNPRTGRSADPVWRTVSVAAQTCFAANTVSTAAIVRGWPALEWIMALGMPARLVDGGLMVHSVGGWPASEPAGRP